MLGLLDRYVVRLYASSWLVSLLFFVGLYGVYDFFAQMDELMQEVEGVSVSGADIGRLYLYTLPAILVRITPFLLVVAGLVTAMRLQRHNELLAMQFTGRSPRRNLRPVVALSGVFLILLVLLQEFVVPRVAVERQQLRSMLIEHEPAWTVPRVSVVDERGRLFTCVEFHVAEARIEKLTVSWIDDEGCDQHVLGNQARYDATAGGWRMEQGQHRTACAGLVDAEPVELLTSSIRPQDLVAEQLQPFDLSYATLLDLARRYPLNNRYRTLMHYHMTFPLGSMLLVLLAMTFVIQDDPARRLVGLGLSILICLGYLLLDAAMLEMGGGGSLTPVLAAWLPVVVAASALMVMKDAGTE